MVNKIDCGFGVTISPIVKVEMGLDYSDYEIKNKMVNNEIN